MILPLRVLQENGYIRLVDSAGDWIAVMTGKQDEEGLRQQLEHAETIKTVVNTYIIDLTEEFRIAKGQKDP